MDNHWQSSTAHYEGGMLPAFLMAGALWLVVIGAGSLLILLMW
jgi:hypothetical protein